MFLSNHPDNDFEMIYYNADGRPASMCGNGGRCLVKFASDMGIIQTTYNFIAVDGLHEASVETDGIVSLKMNDVETISEISGHYILNTGSPHYVKIMDDVMHLDVFKKGREIRYSREFEAEGINVNFVEQRGNDKLIVRTYERGVEDETYACGTGVTAVALAMAKHKSLTGRINTPIKALGGDLNIRFNSKGGSFTDIFLEGPAKFVFKGGSGSQLNCGSELY